MGYTSFEIALIEPYLKDGDSVLDFGSQNDYTTGQSDPPFISEWYKGKKVNYTCIDLAGDNHAIECNWSYPSNWGIFERDKFDVVVDAGSSEHSSQCKEYETVSFHEGHIHSVYPKTKPTNEEIENGYYECWRNKHNACKIGGLIISINPKTGNWPDHGFSYLTEQFYVGLWALSGYDLLQIGCHPAMGNTIDGWNVFSVIKKHSNEFPSFRAFSTLQIYKS